MTNVIVRVIRVMAIVPLMGLSLFIYKLALQPAIHQFYKLQPDMLIVYALVVVAALVHAVLLSSLVLKIYDRSLGMSSSIISVAVLGYCVQMAWLSPLEHATFWLLVFTGYALAWGVVLWCGRWVLQREHELTDMQQQTINSINHSADNFALSAKNRSG
ncbi:MAG: hypothetical protein EOO69_04100 [Moraxellaceae bacterium]|nr:MAG: hypothetical protein EOO69_04100 [Moraxellaceae bacterium]